MGRVEVNTEPSPSHLISFWAAGIFGAWFVFVPLASVFLLAIMAAKLSSFSRKPLKFVVTTAKTGDPTRYLVYYCT